MRLPGSHGLLGHAQRCGQHIAAPGLVCDVFLLHCTAWLKSAAKQGLTAGLVYYGCGVCTASRAAPPHLTGPFSCPVSRSSATEGPFAALACAFPGFSLGGLPACPAVHRLLFWFTQLFYFSWVFRYGVQCWGWAAPRTRAQPALHRMHGLRGVVYTYRPCSPFPAGVGGAWLAETQCMKRTPVCFACGWPRPRLRALRALLAIGGRQAQITE